MKLSDEETLELRLRFGENVRVTDKIPSPKEVAEQESWLERVAGTVGLEKWMWKSRRGLLIAIIVVPPGVSGLVDFWSPPITAGIEFARPYISVIENTRLQFGERLIAFLPEPASDDAASLTDRAILAPTVGRLITAPEGRIQVDTTVFRLTHPQYNPLDGRGTENHGGRWNSPGSRLLYTSDTVLASVEELKRYVSLETLKKFVVHEIHVAGTAEVLPHSISQLVHNDDLDATRKIGDEWFARGETDLMFAPSRVDPASHTVVIRLGLSDRLGLKIIRSTPIDVIAT